MKRLLLATNNPNKVTEMKALLAYLPLEVITPDSLGINLVVEENGSSYLENALIKANAFHQAAQLPTLADDSGLEVDALGGLPGVRSHRLLPDASATGHDRCLKLLELLQNKPRPWPAAFVSEVVLVHSDGKWVSAKGCCVGEIQPTFSGANGFGYDPIFRLRGLNRTMANLPDTEKNRVSHRARAIQALLPELLNFINSPD